MSLSECTGAVEAGRLSDAAPDLTKPENTKTETITITTVVVARMSIPPYLLRAEKTTLGQERTKSLSLVVRFYSCTTPNGLSQTV
jgi:hypothetical protein